MKLTSFFVLLIVMLMSLTVPIPSASHAQGDACDLSNALFVQTLTEGLNCLDDAGWHSYTTDTSDISSNSVSSLDLCPDQSVILTAFDMQIFDGSTWSEVDSGDIFNPNVVACGADGQFWLGAINSLAFYDGSAFTEYNIDEFGSAPGIIGAEEIKFAADGTTWVVTSGSVAHFVDGSWELFEQGAGWDDSLSLRTLDFDSDGNVYVSYSGGVLVYDGSAWSTIENNNAFSMRDMVIDADNNIWVATYGDGVMQYDGSSWTAFNRSNSELPSDRINALAIDAQGRVWAGTQWGMSVFDGSTWTTYQMGNSDLLDNDVQGLLVLGDGPALPETAAKETGSVIGVIEMGREPVAGVRFELCAETLGATYTGATPCEDQAFHAVATTNENGEFVVEDVPPGRYEFVVETPDGGWISFYGSGAEIVVLPGETFDLADIDISG